MYSKPNIQYQHREIIDPSPEDFSDMGALGFQIVSTSAYMGMVRVYFSRPKPCVVCGGSLKSKDPDHIRCQHCLNSDGAEPLTPLLNEDREKPARRIG